MALQLSWHFFIYWWSSPLQGSHCHPHGGRPVQQNDTLHPPFSTFHPPKKQPKLSYNMCSYSMVCPPTYCLIGTPVHIPILERVDCSLLGVSVSLSPGCHPQFKGKMERKNQDLETTPHCLTVHNTTSRCEQIVWAEYAHNTFTSSSTGISPF